MSVSDSLFAGSKLAATLLRAMGAQLAVKTLDEPITSSTAVQNDDALWLPVKANTAYFFVVILFVTGAAIGTGDIKVAFTTPAGANGVQGGVGYSTSSTNATMLPGRGLTGSTNPAGVNGASPFSPVLLVGQFTTGGAAGTMQLQWAQNTSSATATVVKAGSVLAAWQG